MKCILCRKRKAKRYCPAKNEKICPVCCGEKRGIEIDCPLDCEYFVEGQKHQQQKVARERIRKDGIDSYVKKAELYRREPAVFAVIEKEISRMFREKRDLNDRDLATALEQVKNTMKTEKSGIYYEHQGENLYANEISSNVLRAVKSYLQNGGSNIDLEFCEQVVDEYHKEAEFYIERGSDEQEYLKHISRYHPDADNRNERPGTGIII